VSRRGVSPSFFSSFSQVGNIKKRGVKRALAPLLFLPSPKPVLQQKEGEGSEACPVLDTGMRSGKRAVSLLSKLNPPFLS